MCASARPGTEDRGRISLWRWILIPFTICWKWTYTAPVPLKKIKDISAVPSFIHTNILSRYLTPVLFRLSGKQRVQKYHTTDLLLKCDDIASLSGIAPLVVWSGLTALSCHRQLSLVSWSRVMTSSKGTQSSRWKKALGQAVFPSYNPWGTCTRGFYLLVQLFWVQNVTGKACYCLFLSCSHSQPLRGVLAHCNCFSLFFCHLSMFPWHICHQTQLLALRASPPG